MRFRQTVSVATASVVGLVLAGCSTKQAGAPVAAGWSSGSAHDVLAAIPADSTTKTEIYLASPVALAQSMAAADTTRITSSTSTSSTRSASANLYRWTSAAQIVAPCLANAQFPDDGPDAVPAEVPSTTVSVVFSAKYVRGQYLSVCVGARTRPQDASTPTSPPATSPSAIVGVTGGPQTGDPSSWVGYRETDKHRFYFGDRVPQSAREAVIGKKTASPSLADDPDVQAILSAVGPSPSVFMGTELLDIHSDAKVGDAVQKAAQAAGKTWPTAVFAGYAWTPTALGKGTAQFVTVYPSAAEASDAAAILEKVWPASSSRFSTAHTVATDRAVISRVDSVGPLTYSLQQFTLPAYPGFWSAT